MILARRAVAEYLGAALLLAIVGGSGIMGERLSAGNAAVALLANSIATGAGLYALITMFGPVSGAHLNPVVCVAIWEHKLEPRAGAIYIVSQSRGAFSGVACAHAMFTLPILQKSAHLRPTLGEGLGEVIATFGLVLVILLTARSRPNAIPVTVACYITSAYWFTSSTSFANPAVRLARAATDTFAGISPDSVPLFLSGQAAGAVAAAIVARFILGAENERQPAK